MVGSHLAVERGLPVGSAVVLAYSPQRTLDFHAAFWGCVYAGVVAIPVPCPVTGGRVDTAQLGQFEVRDPTAHPAFATGQGTSRRARASARANGHP
jgi:hypothetical protein